MGLHTSHPEIIKRLKRTAGHLQSVIAMLDGKEECLKIAQQLQAVEKAIVNAKETLVHDHIDHCLEHAVEKGGSVSKTTLNEFKEITKYLSR